MTDTEYDKFLKRWMLKERSLTWLEDANGRLTDPAERIAAGMEIISEFVGEVRKE